MTVRWKRSQPPAFKSPARGSCWCLEFVCVSRTVTSRYRDYKALQKTVSRKLQCDAKLRCQAKAQVSVAVVGKDLHRKAVTEFQIACSPLGEFKGGPRHEKFTKLGVSPRDFTRIPREHRAADSGGICSFHSGSRCAEKG